MKIHWLQHVPFEDLGAIADWARVRDCHLTHTPLFESDKFPSFDEFDGLVVMGGPMNIYEDKKYPWLVNEKKFISQAIAAKKKVLGICLGAQLIADALGAQVFKNEHKEIGWFPLELSAGAKKTLLFKGLPDKFTVFHWHGDSFSIPDGAVHSAHNIACANQAFRYDETVLALQFHLELKKQGVERLIQQCGDELVEGAYIQQKNALLDGIESNSEKCLSYLNSILDNFFQQT